MKLWLMKIAVVLFLCISPFQSYSSQKPGKPFGVTKQDVKKAQSLHGREEDPIEPGSPRSVYERHGEEAADPLFEDSSDDEEEAPRPERSRSCCPTWFCWKGLALSCYNRDRR